MYDLPDNEVFIDCKDKKREFRYDYYQAGDVCTIMAFEKIGKEEYLAFKEYAELPHKALYKMRKTIREEININYFDSKPEDSSINMNYDYFKGIIGSDPENGEPTIIVNKNIIALNELKNLLLCHEGFKIKIEIYD